MQSNNLQTEWCLLQTQFDSYEKHSLYIKLASIFITLIAIAFKIQIVVILIFLLILWLQDGIWKNFQSRIETRLLQIENLIAKESTQDNNTTQSAESFQFNSEFLKSRTAGLSLIKEYLKQSLRPTVAFPHIVLIGFIFVLILN
jgi:hypothetical protein